eukprot:gb/GECH01004684.1/.p1 GENE.gb/GECH01004684.1/~~gb/GECH01004684.1/.p1  ORF type:complete len:537 (+),score=115.46 gb/GECH01004684.1/:1-1611(+)
MSTAEQEHISNENNDSNLTSAENNLPTSQLQNNSSRPSTESLASDDVISSSELSHHKNSAYTDDPYDSSYAEEDSSTTSVSWESSTAHVSGRTTDSDCGSEGRMTMRDNDFSHSPQENRSNNGLFSKLRSAFGKSSEEGGQSSIFAKRALKFSSFPSNSGMPPKSAAEEQQHRRQIEEMNRSYKKKMMKEAKAAQKKRERQAEREDFMTKAARIWKSEIVPNWSEKCDSKQTRKLWKHGIPPQVRGRVWELAIGNELNINEDLYCIFQSKAMDDRIARSTVSSPVETFKQIREAPSSEEQSLRETGRQVSREASSKLIEMDLERTFPTLQFFQSEGPLHTSLEEVLETYVKYRPDVGYVQGMSYIAAMLLLYSDTYNTFVGLANMLNKYHFLHFFRMETETIEIYMETFQILFKSYLPSLKRTFDEHDINPHFYLMEWFLTLFSKSLPLDTAARVWDLFFLYGEIFLYRLAIGILKFYSSRINSMSFDETMTFLCHLPNDINDKEFFETIFSVKLSRRKYESAKQEAREYIKECRF